MNVVDDAKSLGASMVQFIGGEPTMHPQFPAILRHAVHTGIEVEVYTNLVHVTDEVWELLTAPKVSLAFSYYSKDAMQHNAVTMRNSHSATRRNAAKAASLRIPIRAGVIDTGAGQVDGAKEDLRTLGITKIGVDRIRAVGRGGGNDVSELCGRCGQGVAAVSPDGKVWPCVLAVDAGWQCADQLARRNHGRSRDGRCRRVDPSTSPWGPTLTSRRAHRTCPPLWTP